MTRVAVVTPRGWPWIGGVETHVDELAAGLARRGLDVDVLTHTTGELTTPNVGPLQRDNVTYRYYRTVTDTNFSIPNRNLIADACNRDRYDIVHLHQYHQPLASIISAKHRKLDGPLVMTGHFHGGGHRTITKPLHTAWRPWSQWALDRVDAYISVSPAEADLVRHKLPNLAPRCHIIPNGTAAATEAWPFAKQRPVVLCVTRLEAYKRVDDLIDAAQGRNFDLVIVGDGPDRKRLQQQAGDNVTFCGKVSDETLARWWATADAYATLSRDESFGLTLATALASGIACVASPIGAHRYVAELSGVDVTWAEPGANVGQLLEQATQRGRGWTGLLPNWDDVACDTAELYQNLLQRGHLKRTR